MRETSENSTISTSVPVEVSTQINKAKHEQTQKHQTYVNTRNELITTLTELYPEDDWTQCTVEEMQDFLE